jgi:hypothetical protein
MTVTSSAFASDSLKGFDDARVKRTPAHVGAGVIACDLNPDTGTLKVAFLDYASARDSRNTVVTAEDYGVSGESSLKMPQKGDSCAAAILSLRQSGIRVVNGRGASLRGSMTNPDGTTQTSSDDCLIWDLVTIDTF